MPDLPGSPHPTKADLFDILQAGRQRESSHRLTGI
jgi:hypothetical protein